MRDYEKSQIIKLRAEGNGYGKIARTLGISLNTVKSFCRRNDVRAGMTVDAPVTEYSGENTTCPNCGTPIRQIAGQKKKKFCCDREWVTFRTDILTDGGLDPQMPPRPTVMMLGLPSGSQVATNNTGLGYTENFAPKSFSLCPPRRILHLPFF